MRRRSIGRGAAAWAPAFFLTGCGTVVSSACEETAREVADDEVLPTGTTVAELAAAWFAPLQLPARWHDGRATELSIFVARGDGPAEWVDLETVTIERRGGPPFSKAYLLVHPICEDHVRYPVDLSVLSEDGDLDVHERAIAQVGLSGVADATRIELEAGVDDLPGMPSFDEAFGDEISADGEPLVPERAFLRVESAADAVRAAAGWSGAHVLDDGTGVGWTRILVDGDTAR